MSRTPPGREHPDRRGRAEAEEHAIAEAKELMSFVARYHRDVGGRTEEELIAEAPRNPQIRQPLELTRRLIDSNRELQAELAKSRESSERLAAALSTQMTELTNELKTLRTSSDTLSRRVVWWSRVLAVLTAVLLLGTIILIILTVVLVQRTGTSPTGSTPSSTPTSSPNPRPAKPHGPRTRPAKPHGPRPRAPRKLRGCCRYGERVIADAQGRDHHEPATARPSLGHRTSAVSKESYVGHHEGGPTARCRCQRGRSRKPRAI